MNKLIFAAALMATNVVSSAPKPLFKDGEFLTGCNYWASNAGLYMWREWNADVVRKDIEDLAAMGVNVMRVFPLWPDFQPLTRLAGIRNIDKGYGLYQNDRPLKNPAGVDEEMMRRFRFMCDVAAKHDVRLVVGLITGWMSGRTFVPPAFVDKEMLTDPEAVAWEVRFVRHFVREMKDHPAIIGWDLGNEVNCLGNATRYQAWLWMNAIAGAIRLEDPVRPVVSGLHGEVTDQMRGFNLIDQGELLDELTTHPYPLFTPNCSREEFNAMRSETHPTAESLLYWGMSGRHCFVEEAGDLGRCTSSPERSAKNVRTSLFSSWAHGLSAYVWWCAYDQGHLEFPPYVWNSVERELGLFTKDREPKPVLREIRAFRNFLQAVPAEVAALPSRRIDAVILVSDRSRAWLPCHAGYMLAKQAGFDVVFANAEKDLPEARLYILPATELCDGYSFNAWSALLKKAEAGATVMVSKGGGTRYSGYFEATGNRIDYYRSVGESGVFTLADWPARRISWNDSSTTAYLPEACEVLSLGSARPLMTVKRHGKGQVIAVNFALELDSANRSECFRGIDSDPRYLVYRKAAALAGIRRVVTKEDSPYVGLTEHKAGSRTVVVAINYDEQPVDCKIVVVGKIGRVVRGRVSDGLISIPGNDAAVFEVE